MAGSELAKAEQFMESPLVIWLNTFDDLNAVKNVHDLADGVLLHKVMYTIDPVNCGMTQVARSVAHDQGLRMQNLQLLVNRMRSFYLLNMQQLIIGSLPNIVSICSSPESEYSIDQMEKLLVLLLGCAVKSEPLVEKMKSMEPIQQKALVASIKQVTHSTDLVCSIDWDDFTEIPQQALQGLCRTAYIHLQRMAKDRDTQYDTIIEVSLEKDHYRQIHMANNSFVQENGLLSRSPVTPTKSSLINPEMLELKKKSRHLQEQLDTKTDLVLDLKEEVENSRLVIQKLQNDRRELSEEARTARTYRDEIEVLKVQGGKVEKLEADVIKYRQKAEDTEYLKKKIVGMKTENDLTIQTKALLEQKIEALTSRSEALDNLQEEYASAKAQLESLQQEKEMDMERIEELIARNAHLELEFKHYEERMSQMNLELETSKANALEVMSNIDASNLNFEMTEADMASKAKVLRLEKEAREMEKTMESLRHAQAKSVELEKINKKLHMRTHTDRREIIKLREEVEVLKVKASRVDKIQVELNTQRERVEEAGRNTSKLKDIKSKYDIILEAKARLEDEVDSLQSKMDLLYNLKDDYASLKAQSDSHSTEHEEDQKRIQELLEQNAQLELEKQICSEEVETVKSQLLHLRSKSPQGPPTIFTPPRISETEMASRVKLQRLEKETQEMEKTMEALRHMQAKCSEQGKINKKLMEQTHSYRKEIIKLKEGLHSNKAKNEKMEKLRVEMKNQELQLEDMDAARRKITELKQQNALLSEARVLLQEEMSSLQGKVTKYSLSQADNMALQVRVEAMESELQEESLRMQELLQQNVQLELDRDQKSDELKSLNDELLQLKLVQSTNALDATISPVHRPMSEDDLANRTKLLRLERDNRELEHSLEVLKQTSVRTGSEMEKMNRKLTATIHADKKEIARLKEELRRERHKATSIRAKSVSVDEADSNQTRKVQELESKFNDAYTQSLSTKDERIQVLEKRVEATIKDNTQLREDLMAIRKQNERLKERMNRLSSGTISPQISPGHSLMLSARADRDASKDHSSTQSDSAKLRERVVELQEKITLLANDLKEARYVVNKLDTGNHNLADRIQVLEKLNIALEEEKNALLTQMNKLLEKNQELLMNTMETKDLAMEDERNFNDKLGELERDKNKLKEQLDTQRRNTLTKERDIWKKSNKSKNILKKGLKKLKGKIQVQQGRSYTFEYPEGGLSHGMAGSSYAIGTMGSVGSIGSSNSGGNFGCHAHEDSMSSSRSISSSNSKQSEEQEEDAEHVAVGCTGDSLAGSNLRSRQPVFEGSPFLRPRKTRSVNLSGVKLRHNSSRSQSQYGSGVVVPSLDPDRIPDDVMSLEDFLAESEKTPNRRRVMELKRASLIIGTPPATPRNSLLLTSNSAMMFDLQEFLSNTNTGSDSRSQRDTIHEVEETDTFDPLDKHPRGREVDFKSSQHSMSQHSGSPHPMSQHSKSSGSLHSSPSITSVLRNDQDQSITNPASIAGSLNENSSSNNNNSQDSIFTGVFSPGGCRGSICSTQSSKLGSVESWATSGTNSSSYITNPLERHGWLMSAKGNGELSVTCGGYSISHTTTKPEERKSLFKKIFHQSSSDVLSGKGKFSLNKPPLVRKKVHRSTTDLMKGSGGSGGGTTLKQYPSFDVAELIDWRQSEEAVSNANSHISPATMMPPGMIWDDIRRAQLHATPPLSSAVAKAGTTNLTQVLALAPSSSELHGSDPQSSDELLSWEDFLSGCVDGDPSKQVAHPSPSPVLMVRRK